MDPSNRVHDWYNVRGHKSYPRNGIQNKTPNYRGRILKVFLTFPPFSCSLLCLLVFFCLVYLSIGGTRLRAPPPPPCKFAFNVHVIPVPLPPPRNPSGAPSVGGLTLSVPIMNPRQEKDFSFPALILVINSPSWQLIYAAIFRLFSNSLVLFIVCVSILFKWFNL